MNSYPKIFTLGQKYIEDIFNNEVIIEEKIDGSQFGFGKINGELICRSKGTIQEIECPDKMFQIAVDYVKSIENKLPENIMFYGEYLNKPKHNTLAYDVVPINNIILFGACKTNGEFIENYRDYCELLGLESVKVVFRGKVDSFEDIEKLLETESVLGGQKIEGFVVKDYTREIFVGGRIIPIMCGKYVSEKFKEKHNSNWKKENTGRGKWDVFKTGFKTEARWEKAAQYLKETNKLTQSPKDIGSLIKRVSVDIVEEEKENIKNFLWKEFGKEVIRISTNGLPEWYKEKLVRDSL